MARLSDLPNEITLIIISLLLPGDLESFTSTCGKIYTLAAEDLQRHRSLKRKHAVHRFCHPHSSSPHGSLSQLLDEVLQEPRTALYVKELTIHDCFMPLNPRKRYLHLNYSNDTKLRLEEAVAKLAPRDRVPEWLEYIHLGREDPIASMLLLLLPNLSALDLRYPGHNQDCFHDTLRQIVRMNRSGAPLARLRRVQIHDIHGTDGLYLMGCFAALPSMRFIHGVQTGSNLDFWRDALLVPRSSNVEVLSLARCLTDPKHLFDFLESFKSLRIFTFDADVSELQTRGRDVDPFWIRSGLSAFARSSLESLTILSHNQRRRFMGDIRCFEAVRKLHTETQLLLKDWDLFFDKTSLVRTLPPKIENLKLECSGSGDEWEIAELISTLATWKTSYVPALRRVEVFTRNGVKDFDTSQHHLAPLRGHVARDAFRGHTYDTVAAACKDQGISLLVTAFDTEVIRALDRNG